jgi:hypothetical protein
MWTWVVLNGFLGVTDIILAEVRLGLYCKGQRAGILDVVHVSGKKSRSVLSEAPGEAWM